jgi:glucose-1-phosphate thymidylyltransferase
MERLKGLILSGGAGTRLRPITHTSAKQLVPVANKPVLFYGIEALVAAGVDEIGIIVSPQTGDEIRAATGDGSRFGASIEHITQEEPLGLAHAVLTAEEYLQDGPFVMYLGDNLLRDGITELVEHFRESEPDALILLTPVPDPSHYGVAELSGERVVRLVEKPTEPPSDLALVGVYMFNSGVFDAARAIQPSARGELEITDTIQRLIDDGSRVESRTVSGWWKDTGQLEDMLEANRLVLEDVERRVDGELDSESRVEGRVVVEAGAEVVRSTVRGPAIVGPRTRIVDSFVGPFTSVAADCEVVGSEIEHSVVLESSRIEGVPRVVDSLVGKSAAVIRSTSRPRATRLMVGDHSRVELG